MLKFFKVGVSALALSAFAVAPVVLVLSADVVVANNGNGNGGGNGNGNGNGGGNGNGNGDNGAGNSNGNSDKSNERSAGKSGSTSFGNGKAKSDLKSFGAQVKSGFGLFNNSKKATKQAAPKTKQVVAVKVKGVLHPSNLGKVNGMINSNPQAKLAHIRNGNFNGTVGVAAAMALAEYEHRVANAAYQEALGLVDDLNTVELIAAFDLIEGAPTPEEIEAAEAVLETADPATEEYREAEAIVGYPDLAEAEALTEGVDEEQLRDAVETAQAVVDLGAPDETSVAEAQAQVLAAYNGILAPEDEETVLEAVRTGFMTDEEIALALQETEIEELDEIDDSEEFEEDDVVEVSAAVPEEELVLVQVD